MKEPKHRESILLSEVEEDRAMVQSLSISSVESAYIDSLSMATAGGSCPETYVQVAADEVRKHLVGISPLLDVEIMSLKVQERAATGKFMVAIGSTDVQDSPFLID